MSNVSKFFKHSSTYLVGQILLMVASFVSFPLYTRLLSVGDYGLLGLVSLTITLIAAFSKLGLQHSIVRFYSDFDTDSKTQSISKFYSTFFVSIIFFGGLSSLFFFLTLKLMGNSLIEENLRKLLGLSSILILFYCSSQTYNQMFRAEQKPKAYILLGISSRYGSLLFSILFYFYLYRNLYGIILGTVVWEGIVFIFVSYMLINMRNIHFRYYSSTLLKESLKYGFPLIGSELSFLILQFGDRYLIQYYLGPVSLGLYSAGYSIATFGAELLTLPVRDAIFPIYMNIYSKEGEEETKIFLGKSLRYFSLIAIPIFFGLTAVSSDLIVLLASNKYMQSGIVVPYIIAGLIIYGTWSFFGAGLFVKKNTIRILMLIVISCCINIALNIILIPKFGIIGAALATLIAYTVYILMLIIYSFRKFRFRIDYQRIFLYLALSVVMYIVITEINIVNLWIRLSTKIIVGVMLYLFLVLVFDRETKNKFLEIVRR